MYIMANDGRQIVNSDFVERFCTDMMDDCTRVIASYGDERKPIVLERYKTLAEAKDALHELLIALAGEQAMLYMPESLLYHEVVEEHDGKVKRHGGSGNHKGRGH